mmetsp:Transcript_8020/g.8861  ORF Transcript_8020/g.8861 Transcript_8020/m.8861 type:complete len:290 (+) Transcript_8020:800-1669(+)|eukprot:CAMPEP_0168524950 /NCGR_PEP_ID=MMETSP0405-20121227/10992_1 /TAXON_ID=498012 /ORGANISM="Trichosphaerium sp, Strain Am-I-7 wt" /LENGTH=289 /DNA_ID=CAMNT_0008547329 /DNA_START=73 /DNA_END=942 /DNA_ORIENTATION=+
MADSKKYEKSEGDEETVQMIQRPIRGETEEGTSVVAWVLGGVCLPLTLLCSWFTVQEREEVVVLSYGKFVGIETEPGCHCRNCWGRELRRISTATLTSEIPPTKVIDRNGNPVVVSGIVTYYFEDPKKAAIDIGNYMQFVNDQAQVTMKQLVSRYPYEADFGEDEDSTKDHEPCLKTEAREIQMEFTELLQNRVDIAGARVLSFQFNELSYAPEIAAGMLKRQQAKALVDARKTIVSGAVDIAYSAMEQLEQRGVTLQPEEKTRLVTNLLTVICAESDVQPTIPMNSRT